MDLFVMHLRLWLITILAVFMLNSPGLAVEETDALPSLELLEFLSEWETETGEWLDPGELEKMDLPEQEQGDEKTHK